MAYPKPLSQKSLNRLYIQSGLSNEQIEFLNTFINACANLYGAFFAYEAWEVYKELSSKTDVIKIKRKDLYYILSVMRREPDKKFYVFEIDEIYRDDKRRPSDMIVALKVLIGSRYSKFDNLWDLLDDSCGKPFFVPENLLEYAAKLPDNPYETELLFSLGLLKSTQKKVYGPYSDKRNKKCAYTGKRLKDFSYISDDDRMDIEFAEGKYGSKPNPEEAARIKAKIHSVNAAERIVNELKWSSNISAGHIKESLNNMLVSLEDMGINMNDVDRLNRILLLVENMHNHQHLWSNHGWSPHDLFVYLGPPKHPRISIGPGLKQAFRDGTIDEEEYRRMVHEAGFEILDED